MSIPNGAVLLRLNLQQELKPFDCGDNDLNEFFNDDCKDFQKELLGVTYIIENDSQTIAFFTLLNDKITVEDRFKRAERERVRKSIPYPKRSYRSYPAVKIGRLAVAVDFKGQGIGKAIVDYISTLFVTNNRTGCKYITVDSYIASIPFYERLGFRFLSSEDADDPNTRLMYLPLLPIYPPTKPKETVLG